MCLRASFRLQAPNIFFFLKKKYIYKGQLLLGFLCCIVLYSGSTHYTLLRWRRLSPLMPHMHGITNS